MRRFVAALIVLCALPSSAQLDETFSPFDDTILMDPSHDLWGSQGGGAGGPLFDFNIANGASPTSLSDTLTMNGVSDTADVFCLGAQFSGSTLTCTQGGTFSTHQSGGTITSVRTPMTDAAARGVTFSGGAVASQIHLDAPNTTIGNLGLNDAIFEFVIRTPSSPSASFGKDDGTSGWVVESSSDIRFRLRGSTTTVDSIGTVPASHWAHVFVCVNRDENSTSGQRMFINGVSADSDNPSTKSGNLDNAQTMTIGADHSGAATGVTINGSIAQFAMWTRSSWLAAGAGGATECGTMALARAAAAMGVAADVAAGSASPSVMSRASAAVVEIDHDNDGVQRLFNVAANWLRVGTVVASAVRHVAFVTEPASTNLTLRSQDADNASWTKTQCATPGTNTAWRNETGTNGIGLESTDAAGSVDHYIRQAQTLTATTYTTTGEFKVGADTATHGWIRNNTVANAVSWVRLSDCAAGTQGAGLSRRVAAPKGNGWCKLEITYAGTAAAHSIDYGYSNADNVTAYDDGTDSNVDVYVAGMQTEAFTASTSYIPTTTATVTRAADELRFAAAGHMTGTTDTFEVSFITPNMDQSGDRWLVNPYTTAANTIDLFLRGTGDTCSLWVVTGGVAQAQINGSTDVVDGTLRTCRAYVAANNFQLWRDGISEGTDVSGTVPVVPTSMWIGFYGGSGGNPAAAITRVRVWNRRVAP